MKMEYDVDYFIKKFEAIPEEKWCMDTFISDDGCRCARGWCGATINGETDESVALSELLGEYHMADAAAFVNDGRHPHYQQPTPKQRILAALHDIKSKGI